MKSIAASVSNAAGDVSILIVNNSPVKLGVLDGSPVPVQKIEAGLRGNVAAARQLIIEAGRRQGCDYVVFIDDDEVVSDRWFPAIVDAAGRFAADAVAGPVIPTGLPDREVVLHGRVRHPTGTVLRAAGAGNLLVRLDSTAEIDFDVHWSHAGGEDSDYTKRLVAAGKRLVWADDAVVSEIVSPSRRRLRWLVGRYWSNGRIVAITSAGSKVRGRILLARVCVGLSISPLVVFGTIWPSVARLGLDSGIRNLGFVWEVLTVREGSAP